MRNINYREEKEESKVKGITNVFTSASLAIRYGLFIYFGLANNKTVNTATELKPGSSITPGQNLKERGREREGGKE